MVFFRSPDQFIIIPTIGFVRDGECLNLVLSWLNLSLSITIIEYESKN